MLRSFLASLIGGLGPFIAIGVSIAAGISAQSFGVFFIVLGMMLLLCYLLYLGVFNGGRKDMTAWLSDHRTCQYKYAYDGYGIAIDTDDKIIFLSGKFNNRPQAKAYRLADVREWSYIIPGRTVVSPGKVIGGGLRGASHNMGEAVRAGADNALSHLRAAEATGLKVNVADIDFPQWFIKFQTHKGVETDLLRWMEIMHQSVNKT